MVYDTEARMKLDTDGPISYATYDKFVNAKVELFPEKAHTKQFAKYVSTLSPFFGLDCATKGEKRIYEFLPPFQRQKTYPTFYELLVPNTETIVLFNSRFESGNLKKSVRVSAEEYNLYLEFDLNSRNYTQWYYFSTKNVRKGQRVKFNLINLMKIDSAYNEGMKPCVFSVKESENFGRSWFRGGEEIEYHKNENYSINVFTKAIDEVEGNEDIKRELYKRSKSLYTLSFTYEFLHDDDTCFFAHFFPYTF